jgi:DNA-binding beta-propeller fold protein YncE
MLWCACMWNNCYLSYIGAPFPQRVLLLLALVAPAFAQPYGFLTPVPVNSFLRGIPVQSGQRFPLLHLAEQGLVAGIAVNSAGTSLYAAMGSSILALSLPSGNQLAAIPLTFTSYSIAISPDATTVYVAGTNNFTSAYLCVINTSTNSITSTIPLNVTPAVDSTFPMAITSDGSSLFLAAGGLVQLQTASLHVSIHSLPGSFSQGIALTPSGSQLWLGLNNTILVLNPQTLAVISSIAAAGSAFGGNGLMITPDGTEAILANNGLRVFNTSTFQLTASLTTAPFLDLGYLTAGPTSGSFLVTNTYGSLVLEVSESLTLLATYIQGGQATASIVLPGATEILAANSEVDAVGTFNSKTGVLGPSLPAGCQAGIPALNSARTHLYVPDRCSEDVAIFDFAASPVERLLHGPIFATKVLVSPDESVVYEADLSGVKYTNAGTVGVLSVSNGDTVGSVTGSLTLDIALSADGSQLYVDDNGSSGSGHDCPIGGVGVFDTSTFALTAEIPNVLGFLALSQDGNSLYVGPSENSLTIVNTSSFAVTEISLPIALTSLGAVAVSPVGNMAVAYGNTSTGALGYVVDTSTNQVTGQFPVPGAGISSAAFAPDGNSIWFLSGTAPSEMLVQESFPEGVVVTQTPAQGNQITFTGAF